MKKQLKGLMVILAALTLIGTTVSAAEIVVEYQFARPEISSVTVDGNVYDRVTMSDAPAGGQPGEPSLPARGANILVPYGETVESIEVELSDRISLGDGHDLIPVGYPVQLSADPGEIRPLSQNSAIYSLSTPYPSVKAREVTRNRFRGYDIATLRLQPVEYIPSTGEVAYYEKITVIVQTAPGNDKGASLLRGGIDDEGAVASRVDNAEQLSSYRSAPKSGGVKAYDMLILTTPGLASNFQPLKDYHDGEGILTEIHTTDELPSLDPDAVREFIRDAYLNDGIEYVLIGGDDDVIPAPDFYVRSWDGWDAEIEYDMPGDVFYACLDGTWNNDGDGYWGEVTDGDGGGDVDLIGEVYVGRAAVGNTTEADRFVNKTLQYFGIGTNYLTKVLMVGEHLGFGGISEYAAATMDELIDGCNTNGMTTVGIPSELYEIDRIYDRDWSGHDWPESAFTNRVNDHVHIINHLGHGSPNYAMKIYNSGVLSMLHNTEHAFVYSQTCLAGHFDGTDCWAETINIKTDAGAFGVIMNSRYGWGDGNSTDGPSQRFNREFWDAVYSSAEGELTVGKANQDSKEDNLYRIDEGCMRWCYYEINLFGDPTLSIKQPGSLEFSYPMGLPTNLVPGEETTVQLLVEGAHGGEPVAGSGKLYYSLGKSDVDTLAMSEVSPNLYEATLPILSCGERLTFYFSVDEATAGCFYDASPAEPHHALCAPSLVIAMEDSFQSDEGWTVYGDALSGAWERGVPLGDGERGDPTSDYDGNGYCYLTGNWNDNSDVDDGTTYLESPVFDLSESDGMISYARWFSNEIGSANPTDVLIVWLSNDGGESWEIIEMVGPVEEANGGWFVHSCWAGDFMETTDNMKLRFGAADLRGGSVVEAAIDAVEVLVFECDTDADGVRDGIDNCPFVANPDQADNTLDGIGDACCCVGSRGNIDCDPGNQTSLGDLTFMIDHLFVSMGPLCCPEAANLDAYPGVSLGDLTKLIDHLFVSMSPLGSCQ